MKGIIESGTGTGTRTGIEGLTESMEIYWWDWDYKWKKILERKSLEELVVWWWSAGGLGWVSWKQNDMPCFNDVSFCWSWRTLWDCEDVLWRNIVWMFLFLKCITFMSGRRVGDMIMCVVVVCSCKSCICCGRDEMKKWFEANDESEWSEWKVGERRPKGREWRNRDRAETG